MKKTFYIRNKKGMTLTQVLLYALIAMIIFASFFAVVAESRASNLRLLNKNDLLYQTYNLDDLVREIKYASDIKTGADGVCDNADTSCDKTKITILGKDSYNKQYSFKNNTIVLTDDNTNNNTNTTEVPQFYNVDSVSFTKVTNNTYNMRLIVMDVTLKNGNEKYQYRVEIFPNAWINKRVGRDI
jgi:hypothetical protein